MTDRQIGHHFKILCQACQVPDPPFGDGLVKAVSLHAWSKTRSPVFGPGGVMRERSRSYLGVAGPAPSVSHLAVKQANRVEPVPRVRCVPPHNRARTLYPGNRWSLPVLIKNRPRKGQDTERRRGSSRSATRLMGLRRE